MKIWRQPETWGLIFLPVVGLMGSFAVLGLFTALAWTTLPPEWQVASIHMFVDPTILLGLEPLPERYVRIMMVLAWFPLSKALVVFSLSYQAALDRLRPPDPPAVEIDADFVREIAQPPSVDQPSRASSRVTDIIEEYANGRSDSGR